MKKKLLVFSKGAVFVNKNSLLDIEIDGQKPISEEKPTFSKLRKHFGNRYKEILKEPRDKKRDVV